MQARPKAKKANEEETVGISAAFQNLEQYNECLAHLLVTEAVQKSVQLRSTLTEEEWLNIHERVIMDYRLIT